MNTVYSYLTDHYASRRVLITGHSGFKGTWLCMWLHRLGAEVLGISLPPSTCPSLHDLLHIQELVEEKTININDYTQLRAAVHDFAPEVVIHMAAQALVRPSYNDPLGTFETNVLGTAKVLEACRHTPSVRAIVVVTSDKCYQNNEWVWGYRESDPMGGHDPYSASKGCAELVANAYAQSYFMSPADGAPSRAALATARAGNAIGGGDFSDERLIPDCIRAFCRDETLVLRYPQAVRPWQHALECLSGYLMLGAHLLDEGTRFQGGWNFAPTGLDSWSVERVVAHMQALWGAGTYCIEPPIQPLHEAGMLALDCTKACRQLGWQPRYTVEQALDETMAWYKAWQADASVHTLRRVTWDQIEKFMH